MTATGNVKSLSKEGRGKDARKECGGGERQRLKTKKKESASYLNFFPHLVGYAVKGPVGPNDQKC